ncbi:hypothetical protein TNCV_4346881 [Trichonephila clavipes]|nr:hypothetical protein TNCV_4346881 [Trichonephila clavipes]
MRVRLGSTDLMAGKVMFLRSSQVGRLDGNESGADSFRSDLVGFKTPRANFLFSVTQALILSTGDMSISKNRLFAIITQPPGIQRTVRKQLPGGEVSDAIRETII